MSGEYSHHRDRAAMASRVSFTQIRLEAELERYRAECQWDKMPAIIDQMHAARFHEDGEWSAPGGMKLRYLLSFPGCFYCSLIGTLQNMNTD